MCPTPGDNRPVNGGYTYVERLPPAAAGRTVLQWLAGRHRHSSPAAWRERIERGEVSIGAAIAAADDLLRAGTSLSWRRPPWTEPAAPLCFAVLHRDADLLAVAKPRGLPCLPNGGFLEHTLLHQLRRRHPEAVPLHRLGRGTSGLVLFARSAPARRHLAADWREGRVTKEYLALASGRPSAPAFTIDSPIGPVPHPRLGNLHAVSPDGRAAVSHVTVLETRGPDTLVSVAIDTGRPHQIRIHLAAAGHPLVGDPLYQTGGSPRADSLPGEGGYWLHSWRLTILHPTTTRPLLLECPPPLPLRPSCAFFRPV